MLEWKEVNPLPQECLGCRDGDCSECEVAGKRWVLSRADELRIRKRSLLKSIERMQRQVSAIEIELKKYESR